MNQVSERKKRIYALQIIKGTIVNQTCRLKLHRQSFKPTVGIQILDLPPQAVSMEGRRPTLKFP